MRAFDRDLETWWSSAAGAYQATTTGAYLGSATTTINGAAYAGEWVQVTLPNTVQLQTYTVRVPPMPNAAQSNLDGSPRNFVLAGSSNGTTWALLDSRSNATWRTGERTLTFTPANTSNGPFSQYRICVNTVGNSTAGGIPPSGQASITELSVRGVGSTASTFAGVEYPPAALTGSNVTLSGQAYGNGAYVTSASTTYDPVTQASFLAFDRVWTTSYTQTSGAGSLRTYTQPDGLYNGGSATQSTVIDGAAYAGEWLQIQLPSAVRLTGYSIATIQGAMEPSFWSRGPRDFVLAGSTDGTTWTAVDTRTGVTDWREAPTLFTVSSSVTASYTRYRLCVGRIAGWFWLSVREMRLFSVA